MDKNYLIKSASKLNQVSAASAEEYNHKSDQLVAKINRIMLERPYIESLIGKQNVEMMRDNHANHARFIYSMLKSFNPDVLVETILWVFRSYRNHGFTENYWASQLNAWIMVLKEMLSTDCFKEVYPIYEWMQTNIGIFVKVSEEKTD